MGKSLGVAIVESQELTRRGLVDMLSETPAVRGYAYASIEEFLSERPDARVVIMSAAPIPEPSPEALAELRCGRELLVLVPSNDPGHLAMATRWSADGYQMTSEISTETLRDALERLVAGETPMPRDVARFLLDRSQRQPTTQVHMTPREREVLALVVEGLSNKQIAYRLGISIHGAKRHVSSIIMKLGCTSRTQVVARSLQLL